MGKGARNYGDTTIKTLFCRSGNVCANCGTKLVLDNNTLLGEICHIEAANEKGERYNPEMTDSERAAFENLIILCSNCHIITNNEVEYSVARLKAMKLKHENTFSQFVPTQLQLDSLISSVAYDLGFSEKEEWGILENIVKYALENSPKTNLSNEDIQKHERFTHTKEKVKLNFPENQLPRFQEIFKNSTAKKSTIESYLKQLSDIDSVSVDELHDFIINKYCQLKDSAIPEISLGDVRIIDELASLLIPEPKRSSPDYQGVAKALVVYHFEICVIGAKTATENSMQLTLFLN